ncbi:MAG: hypothetical protein OEY56_09235, partial [Cyclobacteriaceae bacterium]|nr:hypothetical protein [Cyclobacteriaceae bacterium]
MERSENLRDDFANQWQEALGDAEVAPPMRVWENIDRALSKDEIVFYKRRAAYYRWAAVVALLLAIGALFSDRVFSERQNGSHHIQASSHDGSS